MARYPPQHGRQSQPRGAAPRWELPRQESWVIAVPRRTEQAFRRGGRNSANLGLLLDRYFPWQVREERRDGQPRQLWDPKLKGEWLKGLFGGRADYGRWEADEAKRLASHLARRRRAFLEWYGALSGSGTVHTFRGVVDWRLIVGLGRESVAETGIALSHVYGIPHIPGSALKGLARRYALLSGVREDDPEFRCIFGEGEAGAVAFCDALPGEKWNLTADVMNPHYSPYYQDPSRYAPGDYWSPIPVFFVAVDERSEFDFGLLIRRPGQRGERSTALLRTASGWLQGGLKTLGVGAKTAAGYGYFSIREGSASKAP